MKKKLTNWLKAENKSVSNFIEGQTSNLSVLCAIVGLCLIGAAFMLSNSDYDSESRVLQGALMAIAIFAAAPIASDLYEEEK